MAISFVVPVFILGGLVRVVVLLLICRDVTPIFATQLQHISSMLDIPADCPHEGFFENHSNLSKISFSIVFFDLRKKIRLLWVIFKHYWKGCDVRQVPYSRLQVHVELACLQRRVYDNGGGRDCGYGTVGETLRHIRRHCGPGKIRLELVDQYYLDAVVNCDFNNLDLLQGDNEER